MVTVIALTNDGKLVCKCDFDCESETKCICSPSSEYDYYKTKSCSAMSYHNNGRYIGKFCKDCTAKPVKYNKLNKLINYHINKFNVSHISYQFNIPFQTKKGKELYFSSYRYIPRTINKLTICENMHLCESLVYGNMDNITYLDISDTYLLKYKSITPPYNLIEFRCNNCHICELKKLPKKLEILICSFNNLTDIHIPSTLRILNCSHNKVKNIDGLSKSNIEILDCAYNNFNNISGLPETLRILDLTNNVKYNNLTIDRFPDGLQILDLRGNHSHDMPNIPANILLILTWMDNLNVNGNNILKYIKKCSRNIYAYSPYYKIYDYNDFNITNYKKIIKIWNSVQIIGEWYLNIRYNPKYKYCRKKLTEEYNTLYSN